MGGINQVLDTALTGLLAAQEGMATEANNTSNVNTPGYAVEGLNQIETMGTAMPIGGTGTGTSVASIQRSFDQYVYQEMVQADSVNQAAQVVLSGTSSLSSVFPLASGGAGGLGNIIGSLFTAANTVAQDPANVANRDAFLSSAQQVVSLFQSVGSELSSNISTVNGEVTQSVTQINNLASQIAQINQDILSHGGPQDSATNSMIDQADQLVQQLGAQVGITVSAGASGTMDVYLANGMALVNGATSYSLATTSGSYNDGTLSIKYSPNGEDLTNRISGGQLGGLLTMRSQYASANDTVGGLAVALSSAINGQQALGLDLNGQLGKPLFSVPAPVVFAGIGNTGTATVSATITNSNAFAPGNYTLTDTAGGWQATNLSTGQATMLGSGANLSLDGMSIKVSGAANVGDSFEIEPTLQAATGIAVINSNPSAIAAAAPYVATAGVMTSGAISDSNVGNVTMTTGAPTTSTSLPAGTVVVPSTYFGQQMSVKFTSATTFNVLSSSGATIASGTYSGTSGTELAVAYPSPPAPAGEVTTFTLSAGTPATGDSFVLTPGGTGNNGNMVAMADLRTADLLSGQTLSDAYTTMVTDIGDRGAEANAAGQAAQAVYTRAQNNEQSISGVNLDEEAANLVQLQQAYQANAQVIGTIQSLISTLLTAMHG
ncbi:MAG TPA: flagellar hook-associated protein FlgK [Stellaceae bacterium]|nr:flagellar hook-associated protein FlgK [Stellaceae bacterium]